jgi:lipoprotein-releasing system permease protein
MAFPLTLALRYLGSKKRESISVGTAIAIAGVMLGVAALLTVMSVTGGFQAEFRDKVLGVNAHVLVLKHSTEFRNYREIMDQMRRVPGVLNVAPFSINPMMLAHGDKTATGVLLKGVDPQASLGVDLDPNVPPVLDLPRHVYAGERGTCPAPIQMSCGIELLRGLRREGAKPPERKGDLEPTLEPRQSDPLKLPDDPDAGAPSWLREEMRRRELERDAGPDAGFVEGEADGTQQKGPDADEPRDAGAGPEGDATPDGGYKSQLPDEDELPPDVASDPCADPEQVKKLPGIVIGKSLADTLKLELGDCVTVTSPTIGFQFSGGAVKPAVAINFRVMALFEAGFDQYDSKLVYTDLYEAQAFYDEGDTVIGVEMKIAEIDRSDDVVAAIKEVLPPGAYRIMDWKELNRGLFTALLIQKILMSGVLALIIVVAAFTVVATLIMVVLDKKKEISVLKAMGATDGAVLRVFLYQGLIIGGVGTALGLLLGVGVCKGLLTWAFPLDPKVYFIDHLPVLLRVDEVAVTGALAIVLCLVGTVLPSLWAASMLPADGFRDLPGSSSGVEAPEILGSAWDVVAEHWAMVFAWVLLACLTAIGVVWASLAVGLGAGVMVEIVGALRDGAAVVPAVVALTLGISVLRPVLQGLLGSVFLGAVRGGKPLPAAGLARPGRWVPQLFVIDWLRGAGRLLALGVMVLPGAAVWLLGGVLHVSALQSTGVFLLGIGLVLAIVPMVALEYGTMLAPYFVIDRKMGPLDALVASWRATSGRRIDLFLYWAVSGIVMVIGFFCIGVGALVAWTVIQVGEAIIYARLSRSVPMT